MPHQAYPAQTTAERNATYRPRLRRLHHLMLLAGILEHGPVSMVPLTSRDHLTPAEWQRAFQSWARLAAHAGLITWAVAIHHPYNRAGRRTRPGLHVLCDMHDDARRRLRLHAKHKAPRWRDYSRVKLDQHGLTFADLAHRAGVDEHAHHRVIDNGAAYVLEAQWDRRSAWIYNKPRVSGFIPSPGPPMSAEYATILDTMRNAGSDPEAIQTARSLLVYRPSQAPADRERPAPRTLPPSRAASRQAKLITWNGLIAKWLTNRCTLATHQQQYQRDRPVIRRADAITDFQQWCDEHDHPHPPRQDFPQAMDTLYTTKDGVWDGLTLRSGPLRADDVWDFGPDLPREPFEPAPIPPMPEIPRRPETVEEYLRRCIDAGCPELRPLTV